MTAATIQIPTELCYWGGDVTDAEVQGICYRLEAMIRQEFGEKADLHFEFTATPRGSGIHTEDPELERDIKDWIEENWQSAF